MLLVPQSSNAKTMTSIELVAFINLERDASEPELTHANFLAKVPKVIGDTSHSFECDLPDLYGRPRKGYRFYKREACLIAMSYSYDLQAKVFDRMTALESGATVARILSPAEMFLQNAQAMVDMERRQSEQDIAVAKIGIRVEQVAQTQLLTTRPQNAESITHLRSRAAKQFGIPERIVESLIRQSPYAPKPAGMVRNDNESAQGSTYAIYWIKDINDVMRRFLAECVMVTPHFATHPYVDGRFKLTKEAK